MPAKKQRRATIGADPLDAVVPQESQAAPRRSKKIRATFHIPQDLLDELRDTVIHLAGPPVRLTLSDLAETALRTEIARLAKKHNGGEAFPQRRAELRGGRPIGS